MEDCISSNQTSPEEDGKNKVSEKENLTAREGKKEMTVKYKADIERKYQYLELDVVHRWRSDHAVEGGEAMLVTNLLTVQFKLRLTHLAVHIQSYHSLRREC